MTVWLVVSVALLWALVIALGLVVFALTRQVGILYERVAPAGALAVNAALKVGEAAPAMRVKSIDGKEVQVGGKGRPMLIFFIAPDCPICKSLLPVFVSLAKAEPGYAFVLGSDGDTLAAHQGYVQANGLAAFPYLLSEALGRAYGVSKLPYATLIDGDGRIGALGIVNTREHLESLFEAKQLGQASLQAYLADEG